MKVVIIDDHEIFRIGLRALLGVAPHIEIVGEAGDTETGLQIIQQHIPDVVILDYSMPGTSGLELFARIREQFPEIKVIILTASMSESVLAEALQAGANGVILKQDTSGQLVSAVDAVFRGKQKLSSSIAPLMSRVDALANLTLRERQVLRMIANGYRNREIAEELNIALKTVDTHRTNLMRKLNLHSLVDVVEFANKMGILDSSI